MYLYRAARAGERFPEVSETMFGSPAKHGKVGAMTWMGQNFFQLGNAALGGYEFGGRLRVDMNAVASHRVSLLVPLRGREQNNLSLCFLFQL